MPAVARYAYASRGASRRVASLASKREEQPAEPAQPCADGEDVKPLDSHAEDRERPCCGVARQDVGEHGTGRTERREDERRPGRRRPCEEGGDREPGDAEKGEPLHDHGAERRSERVR